MASWKTGTQKQYDTYLKQWNSFAEENEIDVFSPTVPQIIEFLTALYDKGLGYSALNTARSSLSSIISINGRPVGEHSTVARFLKGIFNLRPALPRNNVTWDPQIVLNYLKSLSPSTELTFKKLTFKTISLLWLLSGQRGQSMKLISIKNITVDKSFCKNQIRRPT